MNNMSQAELDQVLEEHSLWLQSDGIQGALAQLFRANLSHASLSGVNLSQAQISADTRLHQCLNFKYLTCSPEVLPWLILHPQWSEWKSTVTVVKDNQK